MTKTKNRFGILKLGTRPQGGESKRSADNFGHCDLLFGTLEQENWFKLKLTKSNMWIAVG